MKYADMVFQFFDFGTFEAAQKGITYLFILAKDIPTITPELKEVQDMSKRFNDERTISYNFGDKIYFNNVDITEEIKAASELFKKGEYFFSGMKLREMYSKVYKRDKFSPGFQPKFTLYLDLDLMMLDALYI